MVLSLEHEIPTHHLRRVVTPHLHFFLYTHPLEAARASFLFRYLVTAKFKAAMSELGVNGGGPPLRAGPGSLRLRRPRPGRPQTDRTQACWAPGSDRTATVIY